MSISKNIPLLNRTIKVQTSLPPRFSLDKCAKEPHPALWYKTHKICGVSDKFRQKCEFEIENYVVMRKSRKLGKGLKSVSKRIGERERFPNRYPSEMQI